MANNFNKELNKALEFTCQCGNVFPRSPYYDDWTCPKCNQTYELDFDSSKTGDTKK